MIPTENGSPGGTTATLLDWALATQTGAFKRKLVLLDLAARADGLGRVSVREGELASRVELPNDAVKRALNDLVGAALAYRHRLPSTASADVRSEYVLLHDEASRAYAARCGWTRCPPEVLP